MALWSPFSQPPSVDSRDSRWRGGSARETPQARSERMVRDAEAALRLAQTLTHISDLQRGLLRRSHFDPNQPRVPAGHSDGGQWTRVGSGAPSTALANAKRANTARSGQVMSDASPDPIGSGIRYVQGKTRVEIDPSALTGISTIDNTTKVLTNILAEVVDALGHLPGVGPDIYGTFVHTGCAKAVRSRKLPGIRYWDVETTFSLLPNARYGSKDSVRTDVVLRNEVGDIIAIYDVKTGERGLRPARVKQLREKTGAAPSVPVIQLHISRGPSLKARRAEPNIRVG